MLRYYRTDAGIQLFRQISIKHFTTFTDDKLQSYEDEEPETNFVKLIGSAWDNSTRLPSGGLSCKIVQRCKSDSGQPFSICHMINLQTKVQQLYNVNSITRGQKCNINGYVRSLLFRTPEGKARRAIAIVPHDIVLYKNSDETPINDVCIVMMTAFIVSTITTFKTFMTFNLKTHVPVRDDEKGFTGESIEHSHSVIVNDPDMQRYIQTNLTKYDRVFIEGNLNYRPTQAENGKQRMSGNIFAIHIEKI